jgi:hypothetical protein
MPRLSTVVVLVTLCGCGPNQASPAAAPVRGDVPFTVALPTDCQHRSSAGLDSRPGEWSCRSFVARYDWGARNLVGDSAEAPAGTATDSAWTEMINGREVKLLRYSAPVDVLGLVAVWTEAGEQRVAGRSYPAALQVSAEAQGASGLEAALSLVRSVHWVGEP